MLAEGMEDMQIAYACDTQPGGTPDGSLSEGTDAASRLADEWTYNQTGDVPPANCGVPSAIRITLLGRSLNPDQSLFGTVGLGQRQQQPQARRRGRGGRGARYLPPPGADHDRLPAQLVGSGSAGTGAGAGGD